MAAEISHGNGDLDQDELPAKQPERSVAKFFFGNVNRDPSKPFSHAPGNALLNAFLYLAIASLKFSLIIFPIFTGMLIIFYSAEYSLPIIDVVSTSNDILLRLAFVAITFIFILIFIVLIPAFVSRQFSRSIRNSYLIYRVYPNKNSSNFGGHVIRSTLSFGGVLLYAFHIFLLLSVLWWVDIQEDRILVYTYTILSLVLYVALFGFSIWTSRKICKQLRERQHNAREWQKQEQAYFHAKEFLWFIATNNLVSFFWVASVYIVWLYEVFKIENAEVYGPFALGAPLIVTMAFNLISGIVSNKTRYLLAFSSVVVFMIITMWPGGVELSRKAFRLLGPNSTVSSRNHLKLQNLLEIRVPYGAKSLIN